MSVHARVKGLSGWLVVPARLPPDRASRDRAHGGTEPGGSVSARGLTASICDHAATSCGARPPLTIMSVPHLWPTTIHPPFGELRAPPWGHHVSCDLVNH